MALPRPAGWHPASDRASRSVAGSGVSSRAAIRLAPDQPVGHIELGHALLGQKKRADAKAAFTGRFASTRPMPRRGAGLAAVKTARGNVTAASSTFAQALHENPQDQLAQRNLVATVVEAARITGAIAVAAMVVALRLGRRTATTR